MVRHSPGGPAPAPHSLLTPSHPPVLCQLPQSPGIHVPHTPGWTPGPMSPHTSPCCTVPLASQACRLLHDSSKGSGAQGRAKMNTMGPADPPTPFRPRSPSAQPGSGRTGHWGRNSRHRAGHVLASGACPVRRPGWPFHCSCQPWLG